MTRARPPVHRGGCVLSAFVGIAQELPRVARSNRFGISTRAARRGRPRRRRLCYGSPHRGHGRGRRRGGDEAGARSGASRHPALRAPPERLPTLGDMPYDVAAAQKADVHTIYLRSGGLHDGDLEGAPPFAATPPSSCVTSMPPRSAADAPPWVADHGRSSRCSGSLPPCPSSGGSFPERIQVELASLQSNASGSPTGRRCGRRDGR